MKMIFNSRKHPHIARVGILLIAIALIVGTVSCETEGGDGAVKYSLTMAVSPPGAGTTTPTGTTSYTGGTVVNIQAVANPGYRFVSWTAIVGGFANATAATTTFTMPAQNVTVTANFVGIYNLTMAVNPPGGGTATDVTNASPYTAGTVVSIQAVAAWNYQFFNWSAPAGTFGNATAETTTFTMPAQDVTVTANFGSLLDHFTCYDGLIPSIDENVTLEDQFGTFNVTVCSAFDFCNPAEKVHDGNVTPIFHPDDHFVMYWLEYEFESESWLVEVENQFGAQNLSVYGPVGLAVPTRKEGHAAPVGLDHYLIYWVEQGSPVWTWVGLSDEFGEEPDNYLAEPVLFANPVKKTHDGNVTEILNPDVHWVLYEIDEGGYYNETVQFANQFGNFTWGVEGPYALIVPSQKISWEQPLAHFRCYEAMDQMGLSINETVYLEDQFGAINATVGEPWLFANPSYKMHEGNLTSIWDPADHLTFYTLDYTGTPRQWYLNVSNQFGDNQWLWVSGPTMLAVPTQKWGHEAPEGLDHFLVYGVIDSGFYPAYVYLEDQYTWGYTDVLGAYYFANPVQKTYKGNVTEIVNSEDHLVFYAISLKPFYREGVWVANQFGEQMLNLYDSYFLGVPSEKLYYEEIFP